MVSWAAWPGSGLSAHLLCRMAKRSFNSLLYKLLFLSHLKFLLLFNVWKGYRISTNPLVSITCKFDFFFPPLFLPFFILSLSLKEFNFSDVLEQLFGLLSYLPPSFPRGNHPCKADVFMLLCLHPLQYIPLVSAFLNIT